MRTFEEIEVKVVDWGKERGIFLADTAMRQLPKLLEEYTELFQAILDCDGYEIEDGIGDMMVVLTMIAHCCGMTLTNCYNHAYNEIKDRKGKMVNGVFVKES